MIEVRLAPHAAATAEPSFDVTQTPADCAT
jgi:hypothetical protein